MCDIDIEQQTHLLNGNTSTNGSVVIVNGNANNGYPINKCHNSDNKLELIWQNLSYTVKPFVFSFDVKKLFDRKPVQLLDNLNGKIESGKLTAIIGPSGAGKTTLIECLGGRKTIGVTGNIAVNGAKNNAKLAYNSQNESLISQLTVEETLLFASKLKNYQTSDSSDSSNSEIAKCVVDTNDNVYCATTFPAEEAIVSTKNSAEYHRDIVKTILANLGLEQCANVRVSSCSGGQQKRLSIALELISSPSILLLDEPTSGLDSVSCLQCVKLLRKLSRNTNQMIISASIHQPTARILSYFDYVYVLCIGGKCIYNGPTNKMLEYLDRFGLKCPQFHNPADFITEIASADHGVEVMEKLALDQRDNQVYGISESSISISKICRKSRQQKQSRELSHMWTLLKRCTIISFRDPTVYVLRCVGLVMILALISVVYSKTHIGLPDGCAQKTKLDYMSSIKNIDSTIDQRLLKDVKNSAILNFGWIFFSALFVAFITICPTLLTFPIEVSVFIKEYYNGWYSISSYYLAKSLSNIPAIIIFPLIYGIVAFFITEQVNDMWRFLTFLAVMLLMALLTDGFGLSVSAYFTNNINAACIVGAIAQIPLLLFTGIMVQINTLPYAIQPLTYLSYFRLCFEALLIIFYGYERCSIPEPITIRQIKDAFGDNVVSLMNCLDDSGYMENVTQAFMEANNNVANQDPSLVMQSFTLKDTDLQFIFIVMIVQTIFFRLLAYGVLVYRTNSKK